jgi:hypothetical protein
MSSISHGTTIRNRCLRAAPVVDFREPAAADIRPARELGGGQLLVELNKGKAEQ